MILKEQLQVQVSDQNRQLKENDDAILDLQKRIQEFTIRLKKAGEQTDASGIVTSLRSQKDSLERDNQMQRKELEATKAALAESRRRGREVENQLYQIRRKMSDSELKLNMKATHNENLHQVLLRAQEKIHALDAARDRALQEQANPRGKLVEAQDRLQRTRSELDFSKLRVRNLQENIQILKGELDDSHSTINQLVNNEGQLKDEITLLKKKLGDM